MRLAPTLRPVEAAPLMHTAHEIAAGFREGLLAAACSRVGGAVLSLVALPAVRPGGAARVGSHGG